MQESIKELKRLLQLFRFLIRLSRKWHTEKVGVVQESQATNDTTPAVFYQLFIGRASLLEPSDVKYANSIPMRVATGRITLFNEPS